MSSEPAVNTPETKYCSSCHREHPLARFYDEGKSTYRKTCLKRKRRARTNTVLWADLLNQVRIWSEMVICGALRMNFKNTRLIIPKDSPEPLNVTQSFDIDDLPVQFPTKSPATELDEQTHNRTRESVNHLVGLLGTYPGSALSNFVQAVETRRRSSSTVAKIWLTSGV